MWKWSELSVLRGQGQIACHWACSRGPFSMLARDVRRIRQQDDLHQLTLAVLYGFAHLKCSCEVVLGCIGWLIIGGVCNEGDELMLMVGGEGKCG